MLLKSFDTFKCVNCEVVGDLFFVKKKLICQNCDNEYPILQDKYPIFVKDVEVFIFSVCIHYISHNAILKSKANNFLLRKFDINQVNLINLNINFYEKLIKELQSVFSINQSSILKLNSINRDISYLTNFEYLKRDWCWLDEGEKEIKIIIDQLVNSMSVIPDNDNALILGAGAGRFIFELGVYFKKIFALDYSLTMVDLFHKLRNGEILFSLINQKNSIDKGSVIKEYKAFINNTYLNKEVCPFYYVGDVTNMPHSDNSISAIYSIYFTDVVPLKSYINEIQRILKPDGVFFHFGPLEYHFKTEEHMLTSEEIKLLFEDNGFEIIEEDFVETIHKSNNQTMLRKIYNNWFFSAKKLKASSLSFNSVLSINDGVRLQKTKVFINDVWSDIYTLILPNDERFNGAELFFRFFEKLNGKDNIGKIIEDLKGEHQLVNFNEKDFLEIVDSLVSKKGLFINP